MPEFPRAHSERALTTKQPRALRNDADIRNEAGKKAKMFAAGADDMSKKLGQWRDYVEKVQEDTGLFNYKTGLQDISNRAVQDTDFSNKEMYLKEAQDLKKSVVEGIESNHVKNRMAAELNYMETVGAIGIEGEFRKKTVLHHQALYTTALDDAARTGDIAQVEKLTKQATGTVWNELEATKKRIQYTDKARDSWFLQVATENPALAEKMLVEGKFGYNTKGKVDAGKMLIQQRNIVQNQTYIEFTKLKMDDQLTEDMVRGAVDINKMDPKEGASMIKSLNTKIAPKPKLGDKTAAYNKLTAMRDALKRKEDGPLGLITMFGTAADFEQRAAYRAEIFRMADAGLIDPKVIKKHFLTPEVDQTFMNDKTFQNAMEQVSSLSLQYQSKEQKETAEANMSRDLIDKMNEGMGANQALQEVSAERIQADFPDVNAEDLLASAKKYGKPVWQIYKLRKQ